MVWRTEATGDGNQRGDILDSILTPKEELENKCNHPRYLVDRQIDGNGNTQYVYCTECEYLDTGDGEILGKPNRW